MRRMVMAVFFVGCMVVGSCVATDTKPTINQVGPREVTPGAPPTSQPVLTGGDLLVASQIAAIVQANLDAKFSSEITALKTQIGQLTVEVGAKKQTAGGNINEPVTGWILAIALGLLGLSYPAGKLLWILTAHVGHKVRGTGNAKGRGTPDQGDYGIWRELRQCHPDS